MKRLPLFFVLSLFCALPLLAQSQGSAIRLIVRVDDMGATRATNEGIRQSFTEGIATSVEIMAPTAWFPEAAQWLREHPDIDVGLHLTLTSEWTRVKWRPLTTVPSLTDESGYFYPMLWVNPNLPADRALLQHSWKIEEVERELRAQIELAKREIPQLSHVSGHMGCTHISPEVTQLVRRLCGEYQLAIFPEDHGVKNMPGLGGFRLSPEEKIQNFLKSLDQLKPGAYLFVEHPAVDTPEQQGLGHPGYEEVAYDRQGVLLVLTDPRVKARIKERGIELVSYQDLKK